MPKAGNGITTLVTRPFSSSLKRLLLAKRTASFGRRQVRGKRSQWGREQTFFRYYSVAWLSQRLSVYGPVLELQSWDPRKLADIVGDEGYGRVPRPVWRSRYRRGGGGRRFAPFQLGPDFAHHTRVLPIEVENVLSANMSRRVSRLKATFWLR